MFDGVAFGKEMVGIVKGYVERAVKPLLDRLDALEKREPVKGLDGSDGKDGVDGKDADPAVTAQLVNEEVAKAVGALPVAQDGKSVTIEDVRPLIEELVSAAISVAVKSLPAPKDGADGASVTLEDIAPLIDGAVAKAVAAIPVPENGKDGADGLDGKDGVDGRNGLDAVEPIIKDGVLLFTMSNGSVKEIGRVIGADGSDGADGRDGTDGLGFEDMVAEYDGERGIVLRFSRGEQVKEFAFSMPVVIDRGVWTEGRDGGYAKGDAVTWAGSVWISQKDSNGDKPDGGDGWRLSVKRGRDGKDGVVRDLTPKPVKVG
ncbi:hypothetical protein [Devosia sp. 2618]|uniref:hypothetical protein n=1 Tax=Devosia sp. 2618 TaxID=3156454 RepID=UPI003394101A